VNEAQLDAVTGLSGSGPAYVLDFIMGLADGGVHAGLPRDVALKLAMQTVYGSAKMALESGKHPAELRDAVISPAGTTARGVMVLEKGAFRALAASAVVAAAERSAELAKMAEGK
jgi:pyrroline-5-carboxylate reductase